MVYKPMKAIFVGVDEQGVERYGERIFKDNKVYIVVIEKPKNSNSLLQHTKEYEVIPKTVRELTA